MENEKIKEQLKELKKGILEEGIQNNNNLEHIYKIVDIEKDLCEIEEAKEMRYGRYEDSYGRGSYGRGSYGNYGDYGNYGEYGGYGEGYVARRRDSRGRYMERGRDSKYRGDDSLNEMSEQYGRYMENRERYGAGEDTTKSLKYMLESMEDFARMLKEDAQSQEEVEMIRQTAQRIAQM